MFRIAEIHQILKYHICMQYALPSTKYLDFFKENIDELVKVCRSIEEDKEQRQLRFKKPTVITFESSQEEVNLVPLGTVTLFVARSNLNILKEIVESVSNNDLPRITQITAQIYNNFRKKRQSEIQKLPKEVKKEILLDLYYESKLLRPNLALAEGLDLLVFPLPYNGGKLDVDKFEIREWYPTSQANNQESQLELLLVIRPPLVTPAEDEALKKVPEDKTSLNLGYLGTLETVTIGFVITTGVPVGGPIFYTITGPEVKDQLINSSHNLQDCGLSGKMKKVNIDERRIKQIGPEASAQYLTALRSKILSAEVIK